MTGDPIAPLLETAKVSVKQSPMPPPMSVVRSAWVSVVVPSTGPAIVNACETQNEAKKTSTFLVSLTMKS